MVVGWVHRGNVGKKSSLQWLSLTSNHYFVLSALLTVSPATVYHLVMAVVVEVITPDESLAERRYNAPKDGEGEGRDQGD